MRCTVQQQQQQRRQQQQALLLACNVACPSCWTSLCSIARRGLHSRSASCLLTIAALLSLQELCQCAKLPVTMHQHGTMLVSEQRLVSAGALTCSAPTRAL